LTAPIVLMTDFGTRDSYAGVMKGVIAGIAPDVVTIDLTHEIRPQDVAHAAYTLSISVPYFPAQTIFCCVVDPGVGSARRAVAVEMGGWRFVLPDNGILTHLFDRWEVERAVALSDARYRLPHVSRTFHGRDIFAPAAAHLAAGVALAEMGEPLSPATLCRLELSGARQVGQTLVATVIHIDRFGNLITNLTQAQLAARESWRLEVTGTGLALSGLQSTFADVGEGEPVAYIGSDGFLEIAVRNGDASTQWTIPVGAEVRLTSAVSEEEVRTE
jgi:S-adenosyl-L-methionine hydrolase (adenosine-forming)